MEKIKFVTDSNCDIPLEMAKELSIEIIPFSINIDGIEYEECYSFTPSEYYKLLEKSSTLPVTSQIPSGIFLDRYETAFNEDYNAIICTTITSVGSGTYQNAVFAQKLFYEQHPQAKDKFKIIVIDSRNYSISFGYGVILGAKAYKDGKSLDEILNIMNHWLDRLETHFTVFSLKYIAKSGRISAAAKILGEALGMRPIIQNIDGVFKQTKKVRGDVAAVRAVAEIFKNRKAENTDYVILRGESDVEANALARLTTKIAGKPPVGIFYAGPSISTNTGFKIAGMGFMAKE